MAPLSRDTVHCLNKFLMELHPDGDHEVGLRVSTAQQDSNLGMRCLSRPLTVPPDSRSSPVWG